MFIIRGYQISIYCIDYFFSIWTKHLCCHTRFQLTVSLFTSV